MPTIARGQENTPALINFFVTLGGVAFNPFLVRFRIFDLTSGLPGTQIFPVAVGTYEDVTTAPGRFQPGGFYAYDNTAGSGWTPALASTLGQYRIEWQWQDSSGSSIQTKYEDFTIVETTAAGDPLYCSVAQIRDLGLTDPPWTDAQIEAAIRMWQQFIERATRQWFYEKELELWVDGTDSDALHFGVPIISIEEVRINDNQDALEENLYKVYNASRYPADRQNPRIKLIDEFNSQRDIFTAPDHRYRRLFRKGRQNQYIKGTFGNVEEDGSTPALIQRATCKLVVEKLTNPIYNDPNNPLPAPPAITGVVLEEWTDGHKIKYAQAGGALKPRSPGLTGITNDQEILDIIRLYRAPIGVATPAHPSFR